MNLVISIFLILFSIQAFCQIAQPDRIIFLKWGKSSTEIGYQIQDQMPFGPKYFDLDNDENIYISDDLNKKLKKFNKKGILLFQIPAENYPGQIDVLDDHTIILNDGNELKKFDKKGNLMREINVMEVPGLGMVKADHN
ncbi:MAG: hypothetical protein GWN62_12775, partial [Aliifodinibius sp.]|nr:hypothetical protein [Fodinibius sp.]